MDSGILDEKHTHDMQCKLKGTSTLNSQRIGQWLKTPIKEKKRCRAVSVSKVHYQAQRSQAHDARGFADQISDAWCQYSIKVHERSSEDFFLFLSVEFADDGSTDFELEDAILELIDP